MNRPLPFDLFQATAGALTARQYTYARTMPHCPHWYTLRKDWPDDGEFVRVVEAMRRYGYPEKYGRKTFTRFDVNGFKYWTMGDPIETTILINRAHIETGSPYDTLAHDYDDLFAAPDAARENRALADLLPDLRNRKVLDIGCGTGLLAELKPLGGYTGLDPSGLMLAKFRAKAPHLAKGLVHAGFEAFHTPERFDFAVALFGSPSYIDPGHLGKVKDLLAPGGEYFLMFYRPGYVPATHVPMGGGVPWHGHNHETIDGERLDFGNYVIVRGRA